MQGPEERSEEGRIINGVSGAYEIIGRREKGFSKAGGRRHGRQCGRGNDVRVIPPPVVGMDEPVKLGKLDVTRPWGEHMVVIPDIGAQNRSDDQGDIGREDIPAQGGQGQAGGTMYGLREKSRGDEGRTQ